MILNVKRPCRVLIPVDAGLGATTKEVTGPDGQKSWVNPLVKLGGKLMYSKGRMGRAYGDDEWNALAALTPAEVN